MAKIREKMSIEDRAKQFLPFMAVAGLYEALEEKEKEVEESYKEQTEKVYD